PGGLGRRAGRVRHRPPGGRPGELRVLGVTPRLILHSRRPPAVPSQSLRHQRRSRIAATVATSRGVVRIMAESLLVWADPSFAQTGQPARAAHPDRTPAAEYFNPPPA